jgi:hypothetical protein
VIDPLIDGSPTDRVTGTQVLQHLAMLSSDRMDWRTPEWFLELVRRVGPIVCDPATGPTNPTLAQLFYSQVGGAAPTGSVRLGDCGLRGDWPLSGLSFINPPYGGHLSGPIEPDYEHRDKHGNLTGIGRGWGARIAQHFRMGGEGLVLVPNRTETDWWREVHAASSRVCFWSSPEHGKRIRFVHPDTGKPGPSPTFASTVLYHGPRVELFDAVFGPHGLLLPGGKELL